jgi:putative acetyltransferase
VGRDPKGTPTLIRAEQPGDRPAIFRVVGDAFGRDDEARLVDALRVSDAFVPELSLVALDGEAIVGHVLFTRVVITDEDASHAGLALAPVAVAPSHQGKGIGSALIRRGLFDASGLGHDAVIVLGHPEYYPRFGFVPAQGQGIRAPFPVNDRSFMALALRPGGLDGVRGIVAYAAPFASVTSARS